MDSRTDERLERLETHVGRIETRLKAVEETIQEITNLLRQQGVKSGKNYDAP